MKYTADIMDAEFRGEIKGEIKKTLNIVKNLLRKGFPKEQIMKLSECTEELFLRAKRELDSEKNLVDNNQQT